MIMKTKRTYKRSVIDIILKVLLALFLLLLLLCIAKIFIDCSNVRNNCVDRTGYLPDDENWDVIPDTVAPYDDDDFDKLLPAVSLEAFFPPIGDQGQYGTCVAWATGYNLTTALNAIEKHWTPQDLEDPANQTSPADTWMGIPMSYRSPGCLGSSFEAIFEVLTTRGAAHMDKVPYGRKINCSGSGQGDPTNTLSRYRHVIGSNNGKPSPYSGDVLPTVNQIKAYINDTVPLVVAAALGNKFMSWSSSDVLKDDVPISTNSMHKLHAMALVGYDDNKNAFRIRNSWGTDWGDEGSIWVDYDFFIDNFCTEVFMAEK
jgi:hypothetical protein